MSGFSPLVIDGVLAFLLLAVIGACFIVYRRLGTIKGGQAELRVLVNQLNTAVVDAQRGVANLKQSAAEVEDRLRVETRKASSLADELGLITEAGNNLADRIERGLTSGSGAERINVGAFSNLGEPEKKQQKDIMTALREAR